MTLRGGLFWLCLLLACDGEIRLGSEASAGQGGGGQGGQGSSGEAGAAGGTGCPAACEGGRVCVDGSCQCPPPTRECGERCADVDRDPLHCGGCGRVCKNTQACLAGECSCAPGFTVCELGEERCIDLKSDAERCGSCSEAGCEQEEVCVDGGCKKSCPPGQVRCEDDGRATCASLLRDTRHCGACGKACKTGEVCVASQCRKSVPASPCNACPCPSCGALLKAAEVSCCEGATGALCVAASACP